MKVLFLLEMLEDSCLDREFFSFKRTELIENVLKNMTGYVKIGKSVQSHAYLEGDIYALMGGTKEHHQLFCDFLDDHSEWENLGMDYTAFHNSERAVLFNPDPMHFEVWVPA